MLIRTHPNLSVAHRERAHELASPVSWTAHRQGCSTRLVSFSIFFRCVLHPYDNYRRLHWHGPRRWSSSCGDSPHRRPHTASSSQINSIARLLSDPVPSHALSPPLNYDCMRITNVRNSCTRSGLRLIVAFLTILLLMKSMTKVFASLVCTFAHINNIIHYNQDQLGDNK